MEEVKKQDRKERPRREERPKREDDGIEKNLVAVRRVTKVVKGGRTMRFSALVVVGDKKGNVGLGIGKAGEVPAAIDKATAFAKKHMVHVAIVDGTIPHEIIGKYGTSKVHLSQLNLVLVLSQVEVLVLYLNLQALKMSLQKFMAQQIKSTVLRQL